MAKQIKLEIARENPDAGNWLYADLQLPAEEHEIRDAFQRARITDSDTFYELSVYECEALPLLPFRRLDTTTVDEMNFLAKRLDGLNEDERLVLQAVSPRILKYGEDEIISIKDLINLTYGLDEVSIISNVSNPHELGQFVIENDLHRDVETVEDAVIAMYPPAPTSIPSNGTSGNPLGGMEQTESQSNEPQTKKKKATDKRTGNTAVSDESPSAKKRKAHARNEAEQNESP